MKALNNISRIQIRQETVMILLNLYEYKGKIFYYDELFKNDLNALLVKTLETDVKYIAKILELDLTKARIDFCSRRDFVPSNKAEQLLFNMKKIVSLIQKNHENFELIPNELYDLSQMIGKNYEHINWRKVQNESEELFSNKIRDTRFDLDELIKLFHSTERANKYEYLTIITNFYVDFVNMEIFDGFNNEIALIILYALIFQHFPTFKYVSFFKYLDKYLNDFKHAREQASYNWASQFSQTDHLNEVIYFIIKDSIKEVAAFANEFEFEKGLNKSDSIENTILKFNRQFSKGDLRKLHPTVSDSTIERTLERLKQENKIMPIGTGRSAKWQIIIDNKAYIRYSMFDED